MIRTLSLSLAAAAGLALSGCAGTASVSVPAITLTTCSNVGAALGVAADFKAKMSPDDRALVGTLVTRIDPICDATTPNKAIDATTAQVYQAVLAMLANYQK